MCASQQAFTPMQSSHSTSSVARMVGSITKDTLYAVLKGIPMQFIESSCS